MYGTDRENCRNTGGGMGRRPEEKYTIGRVSVVKSILGGYKGKLLVILAVLALYNFVPAISMNIKQVFFILSNMDVDLVRGYILGFGIWAPIVSFLLMIFQSVAVSYTHLRAHETRHDLVC